MQPEVAMMEIELQQMIAASNEVTIDPTETGDPSEADSRFMEDARRRSNGRSVCEPYPFGSCECTRSDRGSIPFRCRSEETQCLAPIGSDPLLFRDAG